MHQKNVSFVTIDFLKILDSNLKNMFIMSWFINNDLFIKKNSDISTKGATFRCLLMGISKNELLKKLNNSVTYDRGGL